MDDTTAIRLVPVDGGSSPPPAAAKPFPVGPINADVWKATPPEQQAQFRNAMVKAGHAEGEVDAAIAAAANPTPATGATYDARLGEEPISLAEKIAAANQIWKFWSGDKEQLAAMLRQQGLEWTDDGQDGRSGEAQALDPPAPGERQDLAGVFVGRNFDFTEMRELDTGLRQAMGAMEIPAILGRDLAERMLDASEAWQATGKSEMQRQVQLQNMRDDVAGLARAPFADVLDRVAELLDSVPKTAASWQLIERGMLTSPAVLVGLYRQAQRLQARASAQ